VAVSLRPPPQTPTLHPPTPRYIVDRGDQELWDKVLSDDNTTRRQLIDQVGATLAVLLQPAIDTCSTAQHSRCPSAQHSSKVSVCTALSQQCLKAVVNVHAS
jgi:hypothetical protein